ncbi:MAG: 50S ribosomal protein L9 [Acidobacteria bacterium]|nr:50S ribosomal protein L9 [Acidobacteriota bacterium]
MKVILNDYVENLGERGKVVEVKPGYARNYLLPKKLAYLDTPGNRRLFEQEQKRWETMDLKRRAAAQEAAKGFEGLELIFERRAGEKDVLFGSVTTADIAAELASRGFEIDRRRVALNHPIKELGSYTVTIRIHRDVTIDLPVHVVRPGETPGEKPAAEEEAVSETEPSVGAQGGTVELPVGAAPEAAAEETGA